MKYFVIEEDSNLFEIFDTKEEAITFLTNEMRDDYMLEPDQVYIVKGVKQVFTPPSSKGSLTDVD